MAARWIDVPPLSFFGRGGVTVQLHEAVAPTPPLSPPPMLFCTQLAPDHLRLADDDEATHLMSTSALKLALVTVVVVVPFSGATMQAGAAIASGQLRRLS
jgi:hypothetical protein